MKDLTATLVQRRIGPSDIPVRLFCILVFAVFFLSSGLANASNASDETGPSLYLGLWLKHVDTSDDTNEKTNLVGLGYRDYNLTVFENSYYETTVFASKRFHTRRFFYDDDVGLFLQGNLYLGLFYGYTHDVPNIAGFTPGVMPTVGVGYRNASVELLYFPTREGGFFMSWLSLRFGKKSQTVSPLGSVAQGAHQNPDGEPTTPGSDDLREDLGREKELYP